MIHERDPVASPNPMRRSGAEMFLHRCPSGIQTGQVFLALPLAYMKYRLLADECGLAVGKSLQFRLSLMR